MYFVAAVGAGDQPGEVVVGLGHGALGVGVMAGGGDLAGAVEGVAVDQWWVGVADVYLPVGDVAGVGGVVVDAGHGVAGPGFAGAVADAAVVELGGDGAGAEAVAGVEVEDFSQRGCLLRVGDELLGVGVDLVAVGAGAAGPFAFAGLGGHAVDDAVDDGG